MSAIPHGLYAITPDWEDSAALQAAVAAALAGGAVMVQYRNKRASADLRRRQAEALLTCCKQAQVPLIINDDVDLALAVGADGVHLGRDDGALEAARTRLGPDAIVGASCYNEWTRAQAAVAAGADYIAFGAMFASPTKPLAPPAPRSLLAQAQPLNCPIACIGGITVHNAPSLIAAGAKLLAVISDLFDAPDPMAQAARYRALFEASRP